MDSGRSMFYSIKARPRTRNSSVSRGRKSPLLRHTIRRPILFSTARSRQIHRRVSTFADEAKAMANFTPISAAIGGALIGLSALLLMLLNGRIAGVTGVFAGLIDPL